MHAHIAFGFCSLDLIAGLLLATLVALFIVQQKRHKAQKKELEEKIKQAQEIE